VHAFPADFIMYSAEGNSWSSGDVRRHWEDL